MLSKNICGQKLGVISGYNNGSPLSETAVLFADNSKNYLTMICVIWFEVGFAKMYTADTIEKKKG